MNVVPLEARAWSRRFRWAIVLLVFIAQLASIFWLSDSRPTPQPSFPSAPVLRLAETGAEARHFLALVDPTLFARPHLQGFSGPAWMTITNQDLPPFAWTDVPEWLVLPASGLGIAFSEFINSNVFELAQPPSQLLPDLALPKLPMAKVFHTESVLRLEGGLARRKLLTKPALRSWASAEILTNSVVQMTVDADGLPIAVSLLPPGSGSSEADQQALQAARSCRFKPVLDAGIDASVGVTFGQIIFIWNTVPLLRTNVPTSK